MLSQVLPGHHGKADQLTKWGEIHAEQQAVREAINPND